MVHLMGFCFAMVIFLFKFLLLSAVVSGILSDLFAILLMYILLRVQFRIVALTFFHSARIFGMKNFRTLWEVSWPSYRHVFHRPPHYSGRILGRAYACGVVLFLHRAGFFRSVLFFGSIYMLLSFSFLRRGSSLSEEQRYAHFFRVYLLWLWLSNGNNSAIKREIRMVWRYSYYLETMSFEWISSSWSEE